VQFLQVIRFRILFFFELEGSHFSKKISGIKNRFLLGYDLIRMAPDKQIGLLIISKIFQFNLCSFWNVAPLSHHSKHRLLEPG